MVSNVDRIRVPTVDILCFELKLVVQCSSVVKQAEWRQVNWTVMNSQGCWSSQSHVPCHWLFLCSVVNKNSWISEAHINKSKKKCPEIDSDGVWTHNLLTRATYWCLEWGQEWTKMDAPLILTFVWDL